jgi:AraC-like DNA-binding protein
MLVPEERIRPIMNTNTLVSPVEKLLLVDEIVRNQAEPFQSQSLPGHLLHIVTAGAVDQWAEGRPELLREGTVVWYHENEPVRGTILRAPWRFITINFIAPTLSPPPDERRVIRVDATTISLGRQLLKFWRNGRQTLASRQLNCHLTLLKLLVKLMPSTEHVLPSDTGANSWWRIEKQLRLQLDLPHTLESIRKLSGLSLRTVIRVCQAATGMPPMKRLKELRLGYARGLVQHTDLPMTEIAFRIGYSRSQELSRDYRLRFHITPRDDRTGTPNYLRIETSE